jgi:uncharacterized protein (TIGR03790 family)
VFRTSALLFAVLAVTSALDAQSLAGRVLVVYNVSYPESADVANDYIARRGIPSANLCAITSTNIVLLTWANYDSIVRQPVRACLNALGPSRILYIVFSYQTPFKVSVPNKLSYSIDQYVADIWDAYSTRDADPRPASNQPYFASAQTEGNSYPPFTSFAAYRATPGALLIYSVWRLDAPSSALAKGLVANARQAEVSGLSGRACFDERGPSASAFDSGYGTGDWDLHRAALFGQMAGFAVTEDTNSAEFGTAAAPRCDGAAMYAGWYALNHYNDAFSWNPGAIGFHLDSLSAADPRGGTNWSANALLRGITVTSGAMAEPFLDGLAHPDIVFRSLLQGANVGDAFLRGEQWLKWMILNIGDPLYRPFLGGRAPFKAPVAAPALILNPRALTLVGPASSSGTVQLQAAALSATVVNLVSTKPAVVTVPPSITVPAGHTTAAFPISVAQVTVDTRVKITASAPSLAVDNTLDVTPLIGAVWFKINTTSARTPLKGVLFLNDVAPAGGVTVQLTSSNPSVASVPAALVIPAGDASANFTVATSPVTANTSVVITARYAGAQVTGHITVRRALSSITLSPVTNATGLTRKIQVNLSSPAVVAATMSLTSSNPSAVPVPASVPVPPGATHVNVTVTNGMVAGTTTITARYAGDSISATATTVLPN